MVLAAGAALMAVVGIPFFREPGYVDPSVGNSALAVRTVSTSLLARKIAVGVPLKSDAAFGSQHGPITVAFSAGYSSENRMGPPASDPQLLGRSFCLLSGLNRDFKLEPRLRLVQAVDYVSFFGEGTRPLEIELSKENGPSHFLDFTHLGPQARQQPDRVTVTESRKT